MSADTWRKATPQELKEYERSHGLICQEPACGRLFSEHKWPQGNDHAPWREQSDGEAATEEATWD